MMFIALAPRKCMLRWALAAALMLLFSPSSRLRGAVDGGRCAPIREW